MNLCDLVRDFQANGTSGFIFNLELKTVQDYLKKCNIPNSEQITDMEHAAEMLLNFVTKHCICIF